MNDRDALIDRIGERIADEVEKAAAGRQTNCEQAAIDVLALASPSPAQTPDRHACPVTGNDVCNDCPPGKCALLPRSPSPTQTSDREAGEWVNRGEGWEWISPAQTETPNSGDEPWLKKSIQAGTDFVERNPEWSKAMSDNWLKPGSSPSPAWPEGSEIYGIRERLREAISRAAIMRTETITVWAPDARALSVLLADKPDATSRVMDALFKVLDSAPWAAVRAAVSQALATLPPPELASAERALLAANEAIDALERENGRLALQVSAPPEESRFSVATVEAVAFVNGTLRAENVALNERVKGVIEALEAFVSEKCEYMSRNRLGDPEKQHTVKQARSALASYRGGA